MAQLFVGIMAEGTTDYRFLKPVVEKTLINIAFECSGLIDIQVSIIEFVKEDGFIDKVLSASLSGLEKYGVMLLIVHSDADSPTSHNTYANKINPAVEFLEKQDESKYCKAVAALVPVFETEAWMLANKELFKKVIGTKKTEVELKINGHPERFNNPKERIIEAIRIGREDFPKKLRNNLKINDLYSILGEAIPITDLLKFESFIDFNNNVRRELRKINLLQ